MHRAPASRARAELKTKARLLCKLRHVPLDKAGLPREPVELRVALRQRDGGRRGVDAQGGGGAAGRRAERETARVAAEVEHTQAAGQLADECPGVALVGVEACGKGR